MDFEFALMSETDISARVQALNSLDGINGVTIPSPVTVEDTVCWYKNGLSNPNRKDFVLREDGEALGFSGISNIDYKSGSSELYIFMCPEAIGKGMGKRLLLLTLNYAKAELNLRKITLYVTAGNDRAETLYKTIGFFHEGLLKQHAWHRGEYVDRNIYSIFLNSLHLTPKDMYNVLK
ncbi:GNAT family protein [Brevundimonas sp. 3P9-tot-E]|uniref:GNAT family N-acetyltransferase n=1 Tax=unclassified Brevundimonas TaxID=2622653 RepID=UPI0039A37423